MAGLRERYIGLGFESSYGGDATPDLYLPCLSETLRYEPLFDDDQEIRSPWLQDMVKTGGMVKGGAEVKVNYQDVAYLLYMWYGSISTTGASDPWTHTFPHTTNGIAARPSIAAEVKRDTSTLTWRYLGLLMTGFAMRYEQGKVLRAALDFIGKTEETGTPAGTAAYSAITDHILPGHCTVNLDGTAVTAMQLNLNLVRPVDEEIPLRGDGEFAVQPIDQGPIQVAGSFIVREESALTNYTKAFNSTVDFDIQFVMDSGSDETMTINMNKCRITTPPTPNLTGPDHRRATYEFTAMFDTVGTGAIQSIVTNGVETIPPA